MHRRRRKKLLLLTIYIGCEKSADKWQNLESKKNFHIFLIMGNLELNLTFEMTDCWYLSFSTYSLGQLNIQHNLNIHPHCRNGIGSPKNVKSSCDRSSEIESSKIFKTLVNKIRLLSCYYCIHEFQNEFQFDVHHYKSYLDLEP